MGDWVQGLGTPGFKNAPILERREAKDGDTAQRAAKPHPSLG